MPERATTPADPSGIGTAFLHEVRRRIRDDFAPRIRRCLAELEESDLWWRPNDASTSIGNLVLHVCGNARQWIVSGMGGAADVRDRKAEFAATGGRDGASLRTILDQTIADVDRTLAEFDPRRLIERRTIRGSDETCVGVAVHVLEHFAYHTGQIVWITKLREGKDLRFHNP
jgi:uncharacterized damage-inducible protein DinB